MTQQFHFWVSKESQAINLKRSVPTYVRCSLIYNSHAMEAAQAPIDRRLGKEVGHLYNGVGLGHKKNETLPTRRDLEDVMPSEASQRNKYHVISLICRIKTG